MPNLNGTGPIGQGPRTGRGLGNCPPDVGNSNQTPYYGRGMGIRNRAPQGTPSRQGLEMRRRAPRGTSGRRGA